MGVRHELRGRVHGADGQRRKILERSGRPRRRNDVWRHPSRGAQERLAPAFAFGLAIGGHTVTLPVLDFTEMTTMLLGMLGLSGMRTLEKIKGAA